jgi:hypothetical protein
MMPAERPEKPPQRTEPCPACKGKGKKPGLFLGSPDDPCPECAGSGMIEVVEPPLTAWQQQIESRLKNVEDWVMLQRTIGPDPNVPFAPTAAGGLDSPEVIAKCQEIIKDFIMKDRSP